MNWPRSQQTDSVKSSEKIPRLSVSKIIRSKWQMADAHLQTAFVPLNWCSGAHAVFVTSSEWNAKIRDSDWSICTIRSKYSILIGYMLYHHPITTKATRETLWGKKKAQANKETVQL